MAKINRYNGNLQAPASAALGTERTIFGEVTQSDDLTDQFTADLLRGWGIVGPSDQPTLQDFNAMGFTLGQLHAYIHQMGVIEYNATQEYHLGSFTNVAGVLYVSLVNSNTGNAPASSPSQWQQFGGHGIVSFVAAGVTNWSVPLAMQLGIVKPKVTVVGGGGSSSRDAASAGAGGGAGGAAIEVLDLTGVTSVTITVGAGGTAAVATGNGNPGGSSSFGAFLSATGGNGGVLAGVGRNGGEGGLGAGGDLNLKGGGGGAVALAPDSAFMSGCGGCSILGGGARGRAQVSAVAGDAGVNGGGGAGGIGSVTGGAGGAGVVIIEW